MALDPRFLARPIAHRGYHDRAAGVIENSPSAFAAAIEAGYGIELDIQASADGEAMVFHDYELDRLTGEAGMVNQRSAAELRTITLSGGVDRMPTLSETLSQVAGRVPLLIEIKDPGGALGPTDGVLERRVADLVADYQGPAALMSFNPHSVAHLKTAAPLIPRGRTTSAFVEDSWAHVPADRRAALARLDDLDALETEFISHHYEDLSSEPVARARAAGQIVLCWTIRSEEDERRARAHADNVTFEDYPA